MLQAACHAPSPTGLDFHNSNYSDNCKVNMVLTHGGRDEMDNISQTTFSDVFSSMKILLMFDPNGPINNIRPGAKPLSEPMAPTII